MDEPIEENGRDLLATQQIGEINAGSRKPQAAAHFTLVESWIDRLLRHLPVREELAEVVASIDAWMFHTQQSIGAGSDLQCPLDAFSVVPRPTDPLRPGMCAKSAATSRKGKPGWKTGSYFPGSFISTFPISVPSLKAASSQFSGVISSTTR